MGMKNNDNILSEMSNKISTIVEEEVKRTSQLVDANTKFDWIAIDLGCTYTSAAYSKKGISNKIDGIAVDMIPINLENGRTACPSASRISENGDFPLVGSSALRGQYPNPLRTLYDSKRMIGMKMTD